MNIPRIGVSLPHFGPHAGPDGVVTVARAAERLGFHAVSVSERLLMPAQPGWHNGADLPRSHVWDPIETLTWAAAHTERIRVSTGIVNAIYQPPILLARRLATLDRLSRGRLDAGVGQGGGGTPETAYGIAEEFEAAGVPMSRRGAGFEEHIAAMRACWGPDPVEFRGEHYRIPLSAVGPKPWGATIPLFVGALVPRSIERAARVGDGFITVALPSGWDDARRAVERYRGFGGKGTVVVNTVQDHPAGPISEESFLDLVLGDLERAAAAGADETHLSLNLASVHPDRQAELLEALAARL
ncbi:TIGR03619 family F420-dependent LLM class oxidoreductase [Nonomuraea sp. NPDC050643]|uniref:TIGR03619 family F420-dependent LLM class oxidoreductase n=1 Tax=Nonomuraea sp. NPDC050643 TaxID=3155660 RepID=UPI0033D5488D